jgi:hypothetical protein
MTAAPQSVSIHRHGRRQTASRCQQARGQHEIITGSLPICVVDEHKRLG